MSDPIPPDSGPQAPSPFDRPGAPIRPGDEPAPTRPGGSGVRTPLLIGCGVILLLVVGAMVFFYANQDGIVAWMLEAMHGELEARLPEDLPDDVRARYDDAFETAVASAREGRYTPEGLQRIQRVFTGAVQGGGSRLSVEEVERMTEALEAFVPDI